ncbi:predicted protein [Nematostella vectensis]|uniref:Creatine kinase n=1 Tax=Nematostella vectensis TaxID=45351 RepID=A7RG45_NEMVE|nr:predicted protein [Nematostella vectensis]|eukprot:XP_001641418.1 predicted protein [Nematostella vectensis]
MSSEEWRRRNGYLRFPAYGNFPDLSLNNTLMAKYLTPEMYEKLKNRKTSGKFTLEKLIQVGVDCPSVPWGRAAGVVAGDEETYTVFSPILDSVIKDLHDYGPEEKQKRDVDCKGLRDATIPRAKWKATRITAWRSLKGYRFPAACGRLDRRQIEQAIQSALKRLKGEFKGKYYSIVDLPESDQKHLTANNLMLVHNTPEMTCSERSRDWPDARGIFFTSDKTFVVHVNEADHLKVICWSQGSDLFDTYDRFQRGLSQLEEELKQNDEEFALSDHLGYIVSDPRHLGTAMEVRMRVQFRHLATDNRLHFALKCLNMKRCRQGKILAVQLLQGMVEGINKLSGLEALLDQGHEIHEALNDLQDAPVVLPQLRFQ